MKKTLLFLTIFLSSMLINAQLIPAPESITLQKGHFTLDNSVGIVVKAKNTKELVKLATYLSDKIQLETGVKLSAKKEKTKTIVSNTSSPADHLERSRETKEKNPPLELIKEYFKFQEYSEFEAERFFNYYTSNGWLIGGKTKMKDWKAAARNWMLNTNKFNIKTPQTSPVQEQTRAYNLHTVTDKNYAEPL